MDHGGADAGYRSDMIRFPDQHFSSACLCNLATTNPSDLNRKVADIYLEKEMTPAEPAHAAANDKPVQLTLDQLKGNVGTYVNQEDEVVRVFLNENALRVANGKDEESYELVPVAPNRFHLVIAPVDLTFDAPKGTDPARLTVKYPDGKPDIHSEVVPFTPTEADLKPYTGAYSSQEIDPLYTFTIENGKLVLHRLKAHKRMRRISIETRRVAENRKLITDN